MGGNRALHVGRYASMAHDAPCETCMSGFEVSFHGLSEMHQGMRIGVMFGAESFGDVLG